MEQVITRGKISLEPIPGEAEDSRSGYIFRVTDLDTPGLQFVVTMSHEDVARLGQVMVTDTEQHPASRAPVEIVKGSPDILRRLPSIRHKR